jgi:type IV secretion system protein VirB10
MDDPKPVSTRPGPPPPPLELDPRPRVTRLNKRALALGIVLLCLVVVAAILSLGQVSREQQQRAEEAPRPEATADPFWETQPDGVAQPPAPAEPEGEPAEQPSPGEPELFDPAEIASPVEDPEMREEMARLRRAMEARPKVSGFQRSATTATTAAPSQSAAAAGPRGLDGIDREILSSLGTGDREPDGVLSQNNQEGKRTFLQEAGADDLTYESPYRVRLPVSPYEVVAGSVIPAVLLTEANSDLPGMLTAQVRENVYDTVTGQMLLIPQGTRIVGVYDSSVTFGQERLLVAWQRLLFPDGSKLNLGSMPGVDLAGAAGFRDRLNRHTFRIWSNALLLSVLSAGLQLSQERESGEDGSRSDDVRSTLSAALGQSLGQVVTDTVRRNMNVQPRIEIRPGYRFNVWVQRDLVLPGPYTSS